MLYVYMDWSPYSLDLNLSDFFVGGGGAIWKKKYLQKPTKTIPQLKEAIAAENQGIWTNCWRSR